MNKKQLQSLALRGIDALGFTLDGLGLSLVNAVAEIHQGQVQLNDTHPDGEKPGLTVVVRLPAFTGVSKRIKATRQDAADEDEN